MTMFTSKFSGLLRGFFSAVLLSFVITSHAAETGLLWKAEAPNGKASYLLGTMHTDDPRATEFSPAVLKAFSDSEAFMMETLPTRDQSSYFMQDKTLRNLLTEDEVEQVIKLADFHAMHTNVALRMKPWLLAVVFDLPRPMALYSMDELLLAKAGEQDKKVLGLEDTAEHFAVLDSFSIDEQLVMLRAVLKHSQADKERDFELLLKAYLSGDTAKIAALDDKITSALLPKDLWAKMKVKLIDGRNVRMAERIANEANQSRVFVAVGASHLPGEGGLLARLRNAGFKLSVVK
ncbi:MAG TPA: TraB/GumN family protein [Methylophilaceae bacterium]|nr:TraB/GumN family protein [Methylophilaceae bacterium]